MDMSRPSVTRQLASVRARAISPDRRTRHDAHSSAGHGVEHDSPDVYLLDWPSSLFANPAVVGDRPFSQSPQLAASLALHAVQFIPHAVSAACLAPFLSGSEHKAALALVHAHMGCIVLWPNAFGLAVPVDSVHTCELHDVVVHDPGSDTRCERVADGHV